MDAWEKLRDPLALGVFAFTLVLPVLVGLVALRRTRSQSDFFVGGGAMGWLVVALSAVSSGRSSWLVLGLSGMAWTMGASAVWAVVGYTVIELLMMLVVAPRLRGQTGGAITLLDWFEDRLGDRRHVVRIAGGLVVVVFMTTYVAAQMSAGARSLSSALSLPEPLMLIGSTALVLAYMVLGGYVAVAWNDVVRAVLMLVGLVVLPIAALVDLGGTAALVETLAELSPDHLDPLSLGIGALVGFVGIGLGSPGQPHIVVRYMSAKDPGALRISALVGTFWNVVLGLGAIAIGLVARAVFPEKASLPDADPEMAYLALSGRTFGPLVFGLLVGGVFAAILSTADSQLLVVSSTVTRDLWRMTIRGGKGADPVRELRLSRWVVVVAGVAAMLIALAADDLVFWLVLFAWGGLGAAIGPPLLLTLFWRGTSRWGVLAGMLTGAILAFLWRLLLKEPTGIYELIPAFPASLVVTFVVSLVAPGKKEKT